MKLLYLTDTHIRGTNPLGRRDDFILTMQNKLTEVKEIIQREGVDYCLHGGDFFDRPDVAPAVVRSFGVLLQSFGVPVYMTAGNHDMYGHNPVTVKRTMLGLLSGLGIVNLLETGERIFLAKDGVKVQLTGQPFAYWLDQEDKSGYLIKKDKTADYAVHVVHGMLLEKPFFGSYTLLEEISATEADFLLVGHYHHGFSRVKKIGGCQCINPGSLARLENTAFERSRKPQVVLLDLAKDKADIKFIPLNCSLPGEEVFNEQGLLEREYREKKMAEFLDGIKNTGQFQAFDLPGIVQLLIKQDKLPLKVQEESLKRLAAAQELLQQKEDDR